MPNGQLLKLAKASVKSGKAVLTGGGHKTKVEAQGEFGKAVEYVYIPEPIPHFILFGLEKIFYCDAELKNLEPITPYMNQKITVVPNEFGTVVVHGGGACSISASGRLLWQTPLESSDEFEKANSEVLFYRNSEFGTEFKVDLTDGRVFCD